MNDSLPGSTLRGSSTAGAASARGHLDFDCHPRRFDDRMLDQLGAIDQEPVVLGIVTGPLGVIAGKAADRVHRLPPAHRRYRGGAVAEVAGDHLIAKVARRLR